MANNEDYSWLDAPIESDQNEDYSWLDAPVSTGLSAGQEAAQKRDEYYRSTYGDSVLPAMGAVTQETEMSPLTKFLHSPAGTAAFPQFRPGEMVLEALGAPKGIVSSLAAQATDAAVGWVPGLYEDIAAQVKDKTGVELPFAPEPGSTAKQQAAVHNEAASVMSQMGEFGQAMFTLGSAAAQIAGGTMPVSGAARGTRLLSNSKTARIAANALEGTAQFLGSTAGMSGEERLKVLEENPVIPAMVLGGVALEGFDAAAMRRAAKSAPKAVESPSISFAPKVSEEVAAVGAYRDAAVARKAEQNKAIIEAVMRDDAKPAFGEDTGVLQAESLGIADRVLGSVDELASRSTDIAKRAFDKLDPEHTISVISAASDSDQFSVVAKQSAKEASAMIDGDVTKLGTPDSYAASKTQMSADLDRTRTLRNERTVAAEQAAQAPDGIERLRALREEAARNAADNPERFARLDAAYREVTDTSIPEARSMGDAVSEYNSASVAILPAVEKKANQAYDLLAKNGKVPLDETGAQTPREIFVQQKTLDVQTRLAEDLRSILENAKPDAPGEAIRALDTKFERLLRKYKINPDNVGFRGDLRARVASSAEDGAEWFSKNLNGRNLTDVADDELVSLAKRASEDPSAPLSTFEFIQNEQARRAAGLPVPESGLYGVDELQRLTDQRLSESAPEVQAILSSPKLVPRSTTFLGGLAQDAKKILYRAGAALTPDLTIPETSAAGKTGKLAGLKSRLPLTNKAWTDVALQFADSRVGGAFLDAIRNVKGEARATAVSMARKAALAVAEFNDAIAAYVKTSGVNRDTFVEAVKKSYEAGDLSKLPPEIQQVIRERVDPVMSEFADHVKKFADNKELIAKIDENKGKYLYRFYNIFSDPDAIFKRLETSSEAYRNLYQKILRGDKEAGYSDAAQKIFYETYQRVAPVMKSSGMTDAQIAAHVDLMVQQRVHGEIAAMIAENLSPPGSAPKVRRAVGALPNQDYFIERVLHDPDVRKIMGEEERFTVSLQRTFDKIVTDAERQALLSGVLDTAKKFGLASDTPTPDLKVRVSERTLDRILEADPAKAGRVIYMHPELAAVVQALKNADDGILGIINNANASVRLGLVANFSNLMSQWVNVPQGVIAATGAEGVARWFAKNERTGARDLFRNYQLVGELMKPGTAGKFASKEQEALALRLGFDSAENLRRVANKLEQGGLDPGNELVFRERSATRPQLEGAKAPEDMSKLGRFLSKADAKTRSVMAFADVYAKLSIYSANVETLMRLEYGKEWWKTTGLSAPTDAIENEAIRRTLATAQDPRTTPHVIRAMNKNLTSMFLSGFQGFQYQIGKSLYNSYKFAVQDGMHAANLGKEAMRLEAVGNVTEATKLRTKAQRYAASATERVVSTAAASYAWGYGMTYAFKKIWEATHKEQTGETVLPGDDKQRGEALKHFLWEDAANANLIVPRIVKQKDGKLRASALDGGRMDLFDTTNKILRAAATPGDPEQKMMAVAKEARNQYLQNGYMFEALTAFTNGLDEGLTIKDSSTGAKSKKAELVSPQGAAAVLKATGKAAFALVPTEVRRTVSYFSDKDKRDSITFRAMTGAWSKDFVLNDLVAKKYTRDWYAASGWIQQMRDEWKRAKSADAQNAVKKKYGDRWKELNAEFGVTASKAGELGLNSGALYQSLTEKGNKVPIADWMVPFIINQKTSVPLDLYLSKIKQE